jgi:hypothetical protein
MILYNTITEWYFNLSGTIFVDFGKAFAVSDINGEPVKSGYISDISSVCT